MTYWTDPIAIGFFYASFILGLAWVSRAVWRALWRRDDRREQQQAQCLAAGIADERRFAAFVEDMFGDEPTVEILVDPPVVPAYVAKVTELDDMLRHATDPKVRDLLLDRRNAATRRAV